MPKTSLIILLLIFCGSLIAQSDSKKIESVKVLGTVYKMDGKVLKPKNLLDITSSNPKAYAQMQIAKTNADVSGVLGFIGGFALGFGVLGPAISGKEISEELAVVGLAFTAVSIPFAVAYSKRTKIAVEIYNEDLTSADFIKYNCTFTFNGSNIGLSLNF